jgi:hypothetical protein
MLKILGAIVKSLVVQQPCDALLVYLALPEASRCEGVWSACSTLSNQMAMRCENHSSAALSLGKCFSLLIKQEIAET